MSNHGKTIAVIGGGSAGFTAARTAARLGARVLFFMGDAADEASLCVNFGCMPSKAMFVPIDTMHHAKRHGWLRVEPLRPEAYLSQIVAWKDREIGCFRAFRQAAIASKQADDFLVIRSSAKFVGSNAIEADGETYAFDGAIIATGSVVRYPPIDGLDELRDDIWTSRELLANTTLPESLTVIGAGFVGLEFAQRYARLGSAVTVIARSRFLSSAAAEFGDRLAKIYEREGIRVLLQHTPQRIYRDPEGLFVVQATGPRRTVPVVGQRVLLAAGRSPALGSLNLEGAGIHTNADGGLDVGEDMRVAGQDHIFAAGDVIGHRMVVHLAHIEAGIAAQNAVNDDSFVWERRANISVVFTDPEFAFAGLSADEARRAGHNVVVASRESHLVGKLHLAGDDMGFGAFVADADTHVLLGAGLLCDSAGELIHLPAYLIEHQETAHTGAMAEYYHPTKTEIIGGIIDDLCAEFGEMTPRRADE